MNDTKLKSDERDVRRCVKRLRDQKRSEMGREESLARLKSRQRVNDFLCGRWSEADLVRRRAAGLPMFTA